jgi:glycosyltransferase involved in cell wall biosynthesis
LKDTQIQTGIDLSVVIPLYRESQHLQNSLDQVQTVLRSLNLSYEVILVDDGSPDQTWQKITEYTQLNKNIKAYCLSRNFGKEAAMAAGLNHAQGKAIITMDGDLQHPPEVIPEMIQKWKSGFEVVEAKKKHRGQETFMSRLRAKLFYSLFSNLTHLDLKGSSDFKLMDQKVLFAWKEMGESNLFFRGMNAWLGFKRTQIEFSVAPRVGGSSGWSLLKLLRLGITAVTSFSSAPLYLLVLMGIGFGFFAFILGIQTLYMKLSGHALDGFTTVIFLLLLLGSAIMFGMALMGVYIAQIYDEVKHRPRYIIRDFID